ncbi:MAG TPA: ATP-binding protein [Bacteroidales bacterium]|nr:ATP-binding protein [Bacteroidales bacterium]
MKLSDKKTLLIQGDNLDVMEILSSRRLSLLERLVQGYDYLFIDEAQMIPHIGQSLKLMVDHIPNLSIFITGSSSLDLLNRTGEPLTGRSHFLHLFPFSQSEISEDFLNFRINLESRLIYGSYPQVFTSKSDREKAEILTSIKNGYLLKDILALDNQKDTVFINKLLRLVAFQIGNDISYSELASNLQVNAKTVQRYLDILEKTYILFSLPGFSRNLRKEYSKTPRYFFWDNGIRNSLISNFSNLALRDDAGKLWENYAISEFLKYSIYRKESAGFYFWRTYDQQEIDLVLERDGNLLACEFKWKSDKKAKPPAIFMNNYQNSTFITVNPENILDYITP